MPRATHATRAREQQAYGLRLEGWEWVAIARHLWGTDRESTARAAALRHARRVGAQPLTDPRPVRTAAAHVATAARWGGLGRYAQYADQPIEITVPTTLRTFGVEIEFSAGPRLQIAAALDEVFGYHVHATTYHGRRCERCGQEVNGYTQWKMETDATVCSGPYGGELVSPVLQGEEGLDQIAEAMRVIKQLGGIVDQRAGLHVHVGATGLRGDKAAGLLEAWVFKYHDILDKMVAPHRVGNTYCRKAPAAETNGQIATFKRGQTPGGEKMRTLNLAPLLRIGTMEVRYHEGCLRPREMRAWVGYLVALFDYHAQTTQPLPLEPAAHLAKLVEYGLLTQVRADHLLANIERRTPAAQAA